MIENIGPYASIEKLDWDTNYFGISCAKAYLYRPLKQEEWINLEKCFKGYQFISIVNYNSDPINAHLIGCDTTAFLIDVNIQFSKEITEACTPSDNIDIYQSMEKDESILSLVEFKYSKFLEDSNLACRGGENVYKEWIMNSFYDPKKFFAINRDQDNKVVGYLLHSYSELVCTIELISVAKNAMCRGIGRSLIEAVEYSAHKRGINVMHVGTQIRNSGAINFYHKVGFHQDGCHQVYHLWNLSKNNNI